MKIIIEIEIGNPSITKSQAEYLAANFAYRIECELGQTKLRNEYETRVKIEMDEKEP